MRDPLRFAPRVPLIGGVTVKLEDAEPMDIVFAMRERMPNYAAAVAQHVQTTWTMLGECVAMLKAAGVTEIRRAAAGTPSNAGNPDNGDNDGRE